MPKTISTTRTKLTPPEIARRYGVSADKVLSWIHSGQLRAFNAASRRNGRPRWLIDVVDLELFEQARVAVAADKPRRVRRKAASSVIEFF